MIKKLLLRNFRNYKELNLPFESSRILFYGSNGQGKTSILEAVFFLSNLRSFRTSQIREIKRIGSDGFYIGMETVNKLGWDTFLEVDYGQTRKLRINENNIYKASEFIRKLKTVIFSPDDIEIVKGNSGERRKFYDMLISMSEASFLSDLHKYTCALKSRNALIKSQNPDRSLIGVYSRIMAEYGSKIVQMRKKYNSIVSDETERVIKDFINRDYSFSIRYRYSKETEDENSFLLRMDQELEKDLIKGFSSTGPQNDEFDMILDAKLLRSFGSTGQCRLVSLCLKMAEVNILSSSGISSDSELVSLVDDVTGELDAKSKESFFNIIDKSSQIFYTFASKPEKERFRNTEFYEINNLKIEKDSE